MSLVAIFSYLLQIHGTSTPVAWCYIMVCAAVCVKGGFFCLFYTCTCKVWLWLHLRCTSSPVQVRLMTTGRETQRSAGEQSIILSKYIQLPLLSLCSYRINSHYTQSELISQRCLPIPGTKLTPNEYRVPGLISGEWMLNVRWLSGGEVRQEQRSHVIGSASFQVATSSLQRSLCDYLVSWRVGIW